MCELGSVDRSWEVARTQVQSNVNVKQTELGSCSEATHAATSNKQQAQQLNKKHRPTCTAKPKEQGSRQDTVQEFQTNKGAIGAMAGSSSDVPESTRLKVERLLASSDPVLTKVSLLTEALQEAGLSWLQKVSPSEMLVHPANRSGQMVGAMDVWTKGQALYDVGVRRELLSDSMCFELSVNPEERSQQIAKNVALAQSSPNLIAGVNGKERFLSVSCSHRCAWLKALASNLPGPQAEAMQLRRGDAKADAVLDLIEGYEWRVFSHVVEKGFPHLPGFIAMALNASNNLSKQVGEVEAMALIAERLKSGQNLSSAVADVKRCSPVCKAYVGALAHYVSWFGGGSDYIFVHFLLHFSTLAARQVKPLWRFMTTQAQVALPMTSQALMAVT